MAIFSITMALASDARKRHSISDWASAKGTTMSPYAITVVAFASILLGWIITRQLQIWLQRWRVRKRFARGRAGEQDAKRFLARKGYDVVDQQISRETGVWVDGHWKSTTVRADFLVRKGGKQFVVEVKTGRTATDPSSTQTRRQLLEYSQVYDSDGLILADMDRKRLHQVWFEDIPPRYVNPSRTQLFQGTVGFLIGLSMGVLLHRIMSMH